MQNAIDLSAAVWREIPNNDTRALFLSLVAGRPFGQQTLLDVMPQLAPYGIALTPANANGERTKIGDPISRRWTRVGFGEGQWVWVVQDVAYEPGTPITPLPPIDPPIPPGGDIVAQLVRLEARLQQLEDASAARHAALLVTLQSLSSWLKAPAYEGEVTVPYLGTGKVKLRPVPS